MGSNSMNEKEIDWVDAELEDSFDEELELEIDDHRIPPELRHLIDNKQKITLKRRAYLQALLRMQAEFVKLQDWVVKTNYKLVVIFEGRDAAGKGGVIKRITQRLDPRICRVVALSAPTEREASQWYFQRYVSHLPAGGEIILFDRSWYNRAGVERVMEFASPEEVKQFYNDVPEFERMLTGSGIKLVKYWFSITDQEQHLRFLMRIHDPIKQWKISPMDLQARILWEKYTKVKEDMLTLTNTAEAPWFIVEANDKKRARLNCMQHLLDQVPYEEVSHDQVDLPDRIFNPDYERDILSHKLYVPNKY
jgi:polyphosphate kinase 2